MTKEKLIRNLKYTMEKHKNDIVPTFGTNISLMCKDILDYLEHEPCENCISREDMLDAVGHGTIYTSEEVQNIVNSLPPVTPQPIVCEDAISRQAILDMATTIRTDDFSGNEVIEVVDVDDIKSMPSVTPTQKWIPVSEPPKEDGAYIVTINCEDTNAICIGTYDKKHGFWCSNVVAWMPLPEPYKESE